MSNIGDLFEIGAKSDNPYLALGFPRNPFREEASQADALTPFYTGHIKQQLVQIQEWVNGVLQHESYLPLSIVGTIGTGKSKIIRVMRSRLSRSGGSQQLITDVVRLTDTGYSRATVGGVLLASLETRKARRWPDAPDGVIPLLWAIINADGPDPSRQNAFTEALLSAKSLGPSERADRVRDISLWLRRAPLSSRRAEAIGLPRKIDWEGELIHVCCSAIRLALEWQVLDAYFLFVDQLEDLFTSAFSDLRRSRLLTDLRSLMDEIDEGAPIGLILSWSPEVRTSQYTASVEYEMSRRYGALYDRLKRRRVDLPFLQRSDAEPLAREFIVALEDQRGFVPKDQPKSDDLASEAWETLRQERGLVPRDQATPRNLLSALAEVVDRRAGIETVIEEGD